MCHSRMTTIATIAAAVSFGSRRLMKSTFRPDFDSNGMQIIWDHEFGFLKETLVAPVPRVAIMLGRTPPPPRYKAASYCFGLFFGFHPHSWLLMAYDSRDVLRARWSASSGPLPFRGDAGRQVSCSILPSTRLTVTAGSRGSCRKKPLIVWTTPFALFVLRARSRRGHCE